MGTGFDSLEESSHTAYFKESADQPDITYHINRQLLYTVMVKAGFTNYPGEWWHFDFGNTVWAALSGLLTTKYGLPENPEGIRERR
jgi:D-alanyl-D-alanine dipeptidase